MLFLCEVIFRVIGHLSEDNLQRAVIAGIPRHQRFTELVEQIHQIVMLLIDRLQAGDEVLIPNEGFYRAFGLTH